MNAVQPAGTGFGEVAGALADAAADTGLGVYVWPELRGASVVGRRVEAYVMAVRRGFQVDMWLHQGSDPFRIARVSDLAAAVDLAVCAALPALDRARWRAVHPPVDADVEYLTGEPREVSAARARALLYAYLAIADAEQALEVHRQTSTGVCRCGLTEPCSIRALAQAMEAYWLTEAGRLRRPRRTFVVSRSSAWLIRCRQRALRRRRPGAR